MYLVQSIRNLFRDTRADELCVHLRALGIEAQLLSGHHLQRVGTEQSAFEWLLEPDRKSIGLIQIVGKNIAYINVGRSISSSGGGQFDYSSVDYYLEYLVSVTDIVSSLPVKTELKKARSSRFWGQVVDLEWEGGLLANRLNGDHSVKEELMTYLQENRDLEIKIVPEAAHGCVRIETAGVQRNRLLRWPGIRLPSRSMFDCLDRIAGHVIDEITAGSGQ